MLTVTSQVIIGAIHSQIDAPPESQNVSNVIDIMLTSGSYIRKFRCRQLRTSMVKNLSGSSSASVRMILDSGSQRTYVTEKLAKDLLQLNPLKGLM